MLATICGRFRLELAAEMGGEAGVMEKQISNFTLAVDGGLHLHFHDRVKVYTVSSSNKLVRFPQFETSAAIHLLCFLSL